MKIEVTKKLNMFGKSNGFIASFGEWQEHGKTKEEAKENLITAINWYMENVDFMPDIRNANSRIVMLNRDFAGFNITAIEKETANHSFNAYGRISIYEAKKYLDSYIESYMEV